STFGLSKKAFVTCNSFKLGWRGAHPMTTALWRALSDNVRLAIKNPSTTFEYRDLKFRKDGSWLRLILPSGRSLCYPSARVDEGGGISYYGVNQYTRKWERIKTHGGK